MFDIGPHPEVRSKPPKACSLRASPGQFSACRGARPDETFLYNLPVHRLKPDGQMPPIGPDTQNIK